MAPQPRNRVCDHVSDKVDIYVNRNRIGRFDNREGYTLEEIANHVIKKLGKRYRYTAREYFKDAINLHDWGYGHLFN